MAGRTSRKNRITANGGFSLIELLVAVTILAAVFVPLMHSFVTAANTNRRAKNIMEATTAGQNLMEELKATDVEQFLADVKAADPSASVSKDLIRTDPANPGSAPKLDMYGQSMYRHTAGMTRTVNGKDYYAVLTLDPEDYTALDDGTGTASAQETDYNSLKWSTVSSLSKSNNAFFIMPADEDHAAAEKIAGMIPDSVTVGEVQGGMHRDIAVSIFHNDSTGVSTVKVSVTYTYHRSGIPYTYLAIDGREVYSNGTMLENELSGVFLCFYPMYNNVSGRTSPMETVTIDNLYNYPVDVYLIRQTAMDSYAAADKLSKYSVGLSVRETYRAVKTPEGTYCDPVTKLTTNLEYIGGADPGAYMEPQLQLHYYCGGTHYMGSQTDPNLTKILAVSAPKPGVFSQTEKDAHRMEALTRAETGVRIYRVTIEIYKKRADGTNELLTTLEGTKME